jgi:uncharacterized membrane protein
MTVPNPRLPDLIALGLLAVAVVLGVVLWPRLPAEMAVHFDASSTPDNFVSRPVGVFLTPLVGVLAVVFVRASSRLDPTADRVTVDVAVVFLGATIAYVHTFILAWNLGFRVNVAVAVGPVLVGAGVLTVYALYREGMFG